MTAFSLCISYMPRELKKKSQPPFPFGKIPTQPGPISWPFDFFMEIPYALAPSALIARANSGKRQS